MHVIDDLFNKKQYESHIQYYLDSNSDQHVGGGNTQSRVELIKKYVPIGSHIFEIGSGGGIDALALQNAGFVITASDFSKKFVEILRKKGLESVLFDAKHDPVPGEIDTFYANAVFVHFHPDQLQDFLHRAKEKLKSPKIIYFSVIKGEGSERKESSSGFERDFQYYSEELLRGILFTQGYKVLHMQIIDKWIQIIAQVQ